MESAVKIFFRLVQDEDGYPPASVESVWGSRTAVECQFVLDNTPFFAHDATLGDTVEVREEDGRRWYVNVVTRSRNSLIRVVFFDKSALARVCERISELGCTSEYIEAHGLLAVNVPITVELKDVQAFLAA